MTTTENVKPVKFAIDLGNKQVKVKSDKATKSFPSRFINKYMLGSQKFSFLNEDFKKQYDIEEFSLLNDDNTYLVGKDLDRMKKDAYVTETMGFGMARYKNEYFNSLLSYSIAELSKDYPEAVNSVLEVELVLGLPSDDLTADIIKHVMKLAQKQHSVIINEKTYNTVVKEVVILPQPIGTLYNLLLDDTLQVINPHLVEQKLGIIDFGGGTQIFDSIQNFSMDENNRSQKETGTYTLFNRILDKLNISPIPSVFQIENILRNPTEDGKYLYKPNVQEVIDITEEVTLELNLTTKQLAQDAKSIFKNWSSIDTFVITGGGANLLNKEMFQEELPRTIFVENSEFSNVEGFYKFLANRMQGDDGENE